MWTRERSQKRLRLWMICVRIPWTYQIVMGIEEEFAIEISQADAEKITTVGEAVRLIKSSTGSSE